MTICEKCSNASFSHCRDCVMGSNYVRKCSCAGCSGHCNGHDGQCEFCCGRACSGIDEPEISLPGEIDA